MPSDQSCRDALVAEVAQQILNGVSCRQAILEMSYQFAGDIDLFRWAQAALPQNDLYLMREILGKPRFCKKPKGVVRPFLMRFTHEMSPFR